MHTHKMVPRQGSGSLSLIAAITSQCTCISKYQGVYLNCVLFFFGNYTSEKLGEWGGEMGQYQSEKEDSV